MRQLHKTQIDQYNTELNNLRQLTRTQNEQLTALHQRVKKRTENNSQHLLKNLVDGMRAIHVEAKTPKFCDSKNPQNFIEKLDKFFQIKQFSLNECMAYLDEIFDGNSKRSNSLIIRIKNKIY